MNDKTVKGARAAAANSPNISFDELITLLNSATLDTNRRILATNLITAFVAAADAATAMSAAAVAASEAATAILKPDEEGDATNFDDLLGLVPISPDSEPETVDRTGGPYTIQICVNTAEELVSAAAKAMCNLNHATPGAAGEAATETVSSTGGPYMVRTSGINTAEEPAAANVMCNHTTPGASALGAGGEAAAASLSQTPVAASPQGTTSSLPAGVPSIQAASSSGSGPWYSVTIGRQVGVFPHWSVVSPLVTGVSNACYAKHPNKAAAQGVFRMAASAGAVRIVPDVADLLNDIAGDD